MPISEERWQERLALYQTQQPAIEQAKKRYDRRQEMLNDPKARDKYRLQRWEVLGQTYKVSRPASDPIQLITEPTQLVEAFQRTFPSERITEINERFNGEYAESVKEQEVKEFIIRRANIAQAAFKQHKMLFPEASDAEAYSKMYRTLIQYGFQPKGLEKLMPFRLEDGRVLQSDYAPVWSEARSLVLGVIRGGRRLGTSPLELLNAGLELVTDITSRNQAGAEVTGSNIFRDARREFAINMGAMEQLLSPDDIPYNFDVAGIMGEQVPNMLATISGVGLISHGSKLAGNALAMGSMFALEGADAYNNYIQYGEQQGLDPKLITSQAYVGAMAYGAASAALERLIPIETFRRLPGLKNRVAAWALGSLAEGSTEFLQSLTQAGIGETIDLGQFNWDSVRTAMREAAAGIIIGGVAGAATIGRITPQVDRLIEPLSTEEVQAKIETELDVIKERSKEAEKAELPPSLPQADPKFKQMTVDEVVNYVSTMEKNAETIRSVLGTGPYIQVNVPVQDLVPKFRSPGDVDAQKLAEAKRQLEVGEISPPVVASQVGDELFVADGIHRVFAASEAKQATISAIVPVAYAEAKGLMPKVVSKVTPVPVDEGVQTSSEALNRVVIETTGLRSSLRKMWRTIVKTPARAINKISPENPIGKLRDSIGRGLSDAYGRPVEWVQGWRKAKGRERSARYMADLMGAQWTKQLKDAGLDPESTELQAIAETALRGEIDVENLPPAVQAWVQTARTMMDAESLYAANIHRAAGLEIKADEFENNVGVYLKNIPLAKVNTVGRIKNAVRLALGLRTSAAFSKVKRDKWLVWDGKKLLGKFDKESEAREVYDVTVAKRKGQIITKKAAEEGVSIDDIKRQAARGVKLEAPIPAEWRKKYEVHDPRYLLAMSMVEARHDAELVQLFNTVAQQWGQEAPQGMSELEMNDWAKGNGLVQLPQSGQLHNLTGIFVPKAIATDLTEMTRIPSMVERAYNAYLSAWKSSKTLWNPATHARNIYGNVLCFSYLARCSVLNPRNAKYYRQAIKSLQTKDAAYITLLENGALGAEYYGGEIQRIGQILKKTEDSKIGQALAGVKVVQKTLGQTYALEDQVFKMAAYHKYIVEGMSPENAAEEVNRWFPNYERIGKVTRWLRKSPIGAPFISFVDQSVRIASRGIAERPLRIALLASLPGILNYISAIAVGLNPDEKELIDEERGYFEPLVPWRDKMGRTQTLDLRYIMPLANDIVPEERRGGLMVPWIFSGPAATAAIEQISGKERFTGKEFIREDMSFKDRVVARGITIARAALPHPSFVYWGTKRVIGSITGDRDEHVANAIVGSIIGLNIHSPYIVEKHIKQVIQNMVEENDWREAEILRDVWNERYKPKHLKNLKMRALAQGLHQSKLSKWRKIRDTAAEALLQGREEDAQEIIDDYMAELGPDMRPLFISGVQYRARQFRIEGKTR